jgi:hypothetical protein
MTRIFVSYRRADSDVIAGRIRDRLARAYGNNSVFMDIDNIPFGVDFRTHIQEALAHGGVLIAVIGPHWLGRDDAGRSRLDDESDPVRLELEGALRKKMPVVPVLVQGATMPKPGDLPTTLRDLAFYNAANVDSGRDFHPHVDRLLRSINQLVGSPSARSKRRWIAAASALLVCFLAAIVVLNRTDMLPLRGKSQSVAVPEPSAPAPPIAARPQPKVEPQPQAQPQPAAKPQLEPAPQPQPKPQAQPQPQPPQPATQAPVRSAPPGPLWRATPLLNTGELQITGERLRKEGYRAQTISGFMVQGNPRYAVLWARDQGEDRRGSFISSIVSFQKRYDELAK